MNGLWKACIRDNPHGIENYSTAPNTMNEMLCMSHVPVWQAEPDEDASVLRRPESVVRVFAVWPRERDARFVDIRTWGEFLVSSAIKDGEVQYVNLLSERGRLCTLVNPWPGKAVRLTSDKGPQRSLRGERFSFPTRVGERIALRVEE